MSDIGFVYILTNEFMPGVFKIGCTERSPHKRAAELSAPTGVPAPFKVLCFIECEDFQKVERQIHGWMAEHRISNNREFFSGSLEFAVRILFWFPGRLAFCEPLSPGDCGMLTDPLSELDFDGATDFMQTDNPFAKREEAAQVIAQVSRSACAGFDAGEAL